jgi:hypothetical protein
MARQMTIQRLKKKYKFKMGLGKDAQLFGEFIEELAEQSNGQLKPEDVVAAAKPITSPIHDFFDWNDETAAVKWRVQQARYYLSTLEVMVKTDGSTMSQKAWFSVNTKMKAGKGTKRAYVVIDRALTESDLRVQVIQDALRELVYWEQKYKDYVEFRNVFSAIEQTKKKLLNSKKLNKK